MREKHNETKVKKGKGYHQQQRQLHNEGGVIYLVLLEEQGEGVGAVGLNSLWPFPLPIIITLLTLTLLIYSDLH